MKKTGVMITVKAKMTAGYHSGLNAEIIEGQEYTIDETQFGSQLFERPSPDWLAPWECAEVKTAPSNQPADVKADDIKAGGKKP